MGRKRLLNLVNKNSAAFNIFKKSIVYGGPINKKALNKYTRTGNRITRIRKRKNLL
jgi:hypothetical protein